MALMALRQMPGAWSPPSRWQRPAWHPPATGRQVRTLYIPGQSYVLEAGAAVQQGAVAATGVGKAATASAGGAVKSKALFIGGSTAAGYLGARDFLRDHLGAGAGSSGPTVDSATAAASGATWGAVSQTPLSAAGYVKSGILATGAVVKGGAATVGAGTAALYVKARGLLTGADEVLPPPPTHGVSPSVPMEPEDLAALYPSATLADTIFERVDSVLNWFTIPSLNPLYYVAALITWIHGSVGLPWWGALLAIAFVFRSCMIGPMIFAQKYLAMKNKIETDPETAALTKQSMALKANTKENTKLRTKLDAQKKDLAARICPDYKAWKWLAPYGVNLVGWSSMFWAVRGILKDNPSLKEGGALWFRDLTQADPYFVLPLFSWMMQGLAAEISFARNPSTTGNMNQDNTKVMMRIGTHGMLFVLSFVVGSQMAAGIVLFWVTNATFAVLQNLILYNPRFRKWMKIPDARPIVKELRKSDFPQEPRPLMLSDGTVRAAVPIPVREKEQRQLLAARNQRFEPPPPPPFVGPRPVRESHRRPRHPAVA